MKPNSKLANNKSTSSIKAIAEALGISIATVDRALHERGRISDKTRNRVLRMAAQLDYKPNLAARQLRLNRRYRVAVCLPATVASFFDSLRSGVGEGAAPFSSVLDIEFKSYHGETDQALGSVYSALQAGANGIITAPANTPQMIDFVRSANEKGVPVICVSTDAPDSGRLTAVTAHPFSCGAMAAEVLADHAKQRSKLAVLTGDLKRLNHSEKLRGFRTMLSQIAPERDSVEIFESHDDPREAYRQAHDLLETQQKVSGIYITSSNSIPALEALRAMRRLGTVPVVCTDVFPELIPFLRDGAVKATIYQCPEMQGSIAIQTMYRYLSEGIVPPHSIDVIPQLVMRSNVELYMKNGVGIPPVKIASVR
jgi:LacI family transcriptional regulator